MKRQYRILEFMRSDGIHFIAQTKWFFPWWVDIGYSTHHDSKDKAEKEIEDDIRLRTTPDKYHPYPSEE